MAETTEQKTVLTIDTSGSVKSVKDLKQQIKDLKDKIVELTSAGEDASEEYAQLGTSMRQLKDINEDAMRSSKDLGDQLAVVTGSMKGVAGAISTVSGVMSLMGVESEKGTKLLKTMASAMSITTGIQAMESGYKSVKKLVGGFLLAAKGAKTMGAAIKAAFMSNPIGLMLTAVTTLVTAIGSIASASKKAAEEAKKYFDELAQNVSDDIAQINKNADANDVIQRNWDDYAKFYNQYVELHNKMLAEGKDDAVELTEALRQEYEQRLANALKYGNKYKALEYEILLGIVADDANLIAEGFRKREEYMKKSMDNVNKKREADKKAAEDEKKRQEEAAKAATEATKKRLQNEKKAIEDQLKLAKTRTERLMELDKEELTKRYRNGEISEEEFNASMLAIDSKYYDESQKQLQTYIDQMNALVEKYKNNRTLSEEDRANIFTQEQLESYQKQIDDLRRQGQDALYEYTQNRAETMLDKSEYEAAVEMQRRINQIEQESFDKRLQIQSEYANESHLISKNRYQMELELLEEQRQHENQLYDAFLEENANKMAALNERYANGLISEQEFVESRDTLSQEMVEREREHSKTLVEIKENEVEQKKSIEGMYEEFERSMAGSISTILNGLADTLGEENESYKGLKIAATLIDTFQGSIAAYTGMVKTIDGVPGIIAGIAAAAGVIMTGMSTIKQMQKVDAKNGTTSTSQIATQQFTTPQTATIATGATNDYTDIMGNAISDNIQTAQQSQRVYVVYSDIEQAGGRRTQVVNSNTF